MVKMLSDKQYVMKTTNHGTHVDIWNQSVMVRIAGLLGEDDDDDILLGRFKLPPFK